MTTGATWISNRAAESSSGNRPRLCGRTAAKAVVLVALLVGPRGARASDCPVRTDAIATDRPDTTNSSVVVPHGSLQMENGANWAVRQGSDVLDGSETRVRLGVGRCSEVLIDVPNYFAAFNGLATSELSNLVISIKRQLFTERPSFSLSAVAGLGFPVGHSEGSGHFYTPYVQFPWSFAITEDWSVNGMLTVTWSVNQAVHKANIEPTFVVEREFGTKGDLFVEYIGDYATRDRASQIVDVGGGWHVTPRQQVDFHVGVGLTPAAPAHYVGVGYSFRIDSLFGGAGRTETR